MAASYYNGLIFKTLLQARWAAFFDLAGWRYWTNPASVGNWQPDFKVEFPCGHSECGPTHTLLVSVLDTSDQSELTKHRSVSHDWHIKGDDGGWVADAGAGLATVLMRATG